MSKVTIKRANDGWQIFEGEKLKFWRTFSSHDQAHDWLVDLASRNGIICPQVTVDCREVA